MSKIKVIRVSATEFETEDGKVFPHPIPFQDGKVPSVKEFQAIHDQCGKSSKLKDSSQERLLGPGKTAELLGVHISTLRRWDEDGTLEAVRTPGGWRKYRLSDIEKFQGRESPRT